MSSAAHAPSEQLHVGAVVPRISDLRRYFSGWLGVVDAFNMALSADQLYDTHADPLCTVELQRRCPREFVCMKALYASLLAAHSDSPLEPSSRRSTLAPGAYGMSGEAVETLERQARLLNCSAAVWEGPGWCRTGTR